MTLKIQGQGQDENLIRSFIGESHQPILPKMKMKKIQKVFQKLLQKSAAGGSAGLRGGIRTGIKNIRSPLVYQGA